MCLVFDFMVDHDEQLLADARGPRRAYDANGNFNMTWYQERVKCFEFFKDECDKEFRLYVYEADGSYQLSELWYREPLLGSW